MSNKFRNMVQKSFFFIVIITLLAFSGCFDRPENNGLKVIEKPVNSPVKAVNTLSEPDNSGDLISESTPESIPDLVSDETKNNDSESSVISVFSGSSKSGNSGNTNSQVDENPSKNNFVNLLKNSDKTKSDLPPPAIPGGI